MLLYIDRNPKQTYAVSEKQTFMGLTFEVDYALAQKILTHAAEWEQVQGYLRKLMEKEANPELPEVLQDVTRNTRKKVSKQAGSKRSTKSAKQPD